MALNENDLKKSFQSLSTRYGGSLIFEKKHLNQGEVVIFIGLGGLGCKTINRIKAASAEKLDNPDRRFFLAVDTDRIELENLIAENDGNAMAAGGNLTQDETLFLPSPADKIGNPGPEIDSWCRRDAFKNVNIGDCGAQGIRQLGRVMLLSNGNYYYASNRLHYLIANAVNAARATAVGVKIYIIAGLGGGTGSGTIIDFTYMVRKELCFYDFAHGKIEGVIYTPDVQFGDRGISIQKKKSIEANFYAAMKEIDFFYNNRAKDTEYHCPYDMCRRDVHQKDIFDYCTLVSKRAQGFSIAENSNEVIEKVAEALTLEISEIPQDSYGLSRYLYGVWLYDILGCFNIWWNLNSNGNGLDMPDWAPPRYSSLAYASYYVPRDEFIAYGANLLMEKLVDHWKKSDITDADLKNFFREYHITSCKDFTEAFVDISKYSFIIDNVNYDLPHDGFGPLPVKNCMAYLENIRHTVKSSEIYWNINLPQSDGSPDTIFINLIEKLVNDVFTDPHKGPVYAVNLLSAGFSEYNDGRKGILMQIKEIAENIPNEVILCKEELKRIYSDLSKTANEYDGKLKIGADKLQKFTYDCQKYGESLLKCLILDNSLVWFYSIFSKLVELNDKIHRVYAYVEELTDVIKKDSQYAENPCRHREGETSVFSFDLTDFVEDERSRRLKRMFKNIVDNKSVLEETEKFTSLVFDKLSLLLNFPDKNSSNATSEDVIKVIRDYFRSCFPEFAQDAIEKFCFVAFSDGEMTSESLSEAWNDPELKRFILRNAADEIRNKIYTDNGIMLSCADSEKDLQKFYCYEFFSAPPETEEISEELRDLLIFFFILDTGWSEFIGFRRIFGFPLALLADLNEYKKQYDEHADLPGIHLSEVYDDESDNWRTALPEPYSYKAARYLNRYAEGGQDVSENDRKAMEKIFRLAKEAKELGILYKKDECDADSVAYCTLTWRLADYADVLNNKTEVCENIRRTVQSFVSENREPEFFVVLKEAGYETGYTTDINWDEYNREMRNRTDLGDERDFGNLIVLFRSNPYWVKQLESGVALFRELREIYDKVLEELADSQKSE